MTLKISEKIWYIKSCSVEKQDMAYVTYYEDNKAFERRKQTGTEWSKGYYRPQNQPTYNEPVICDNVLLAGYKILTNTSRYSTSNVVWRILDPRGFIFEIYSDNMCDLILETKIDNGLILEECILAFAKGKVVLLSKNSELCIDKN